MRILALAGLALLPLVCGSSASAQNAGQIFDFFAGQINQQIEYERQQQFLRQQQQINQRNWQIFQGQWRACFDHDDIASCDNALAFPNLQPVDRQRLFDQRTRIIAAREAQQEQIRREQAEAAERERQARIEAEQQERRLEAERREALERERQQELERHRAEAARVRRAREAEQERIAGLRALALALDGCRRYVIDSCDAAFKSALATKDEVDKMHGWRQIATRFADDRAHCQAGSITACDAALASAAVTDADRNSLSQWRTAASPFNRTIASVTAYTTATLAIAASLPANIRDLPLSTQISGGVAAALGFVLIAVMIRRSPTAPGGGQQPASPPLPERKQRTGVIQSRYQWLQRAAGRLMAWRQPASDKTATAAPATATKVQPSPIATSNIKAQPPPLPNTVGTPAGPAQAGGEPPDRVIGPAQDQLPVPIEQPVRERDTPAAIIALQLANSYIDEVRKTPTPEPDDKAGLRAALSTLALATKQLAIAEQKDPDAIAEIDCDGEMLPFTLADLQSDALLQEGAILWTTSPGRAMRALERAIAITPDHARPYYFLGLIHSGEHNPQRAAAALQKAVELEPTNIEYHKALDRARNISGTEVVGYKVTRAGERVYDTAIGVANTGIRAWNIFAITWNIFATIYNIITAPIRIPLKFVLWIAGHR